MEKKTYTIFSNYDVCSEENFNSAKECILDNRFDFAELNEDGTIEETDEYGKIVNITREEYAKTISDETVYDECYEQNRFWYEDEESMLTHNSEGSLIAIADIGLWNGRVTGYKELNNLAEVLRTEDDYLEVYVDSNGDLRRRQSNHDGSSSVLFRYWKDGITQEQIDNFETKCYEGKLKPSDITRYTRKAGVKIAEEYGWKVRK